MQLGVFDIYFATLVGMAIHPGYSRDNVTQPSLEDCAKTAMDMIKVRDKYLPEEANNKGEV